MAGETKRHSYVIGATEIAARPLEPALYLVATPIGNLADITLRALETLAAADIVACEDTRVSRVLLERYGIRRRTTAYHEHNAAEAGPKLIEALDEFAGALATGRADAVLAAEEGLAAAVSQIRTADLTLLSRHPDARRRIDDARFTLSRCPALGAVASGLTALAGVPAYGPRGRQTAHLPLVSSSLSRV